MTLSFACTKVVLEIMKYQSAVQTRLNKISQENSATALPQKSEQFRTGRLCQGWYFDPHPWPRQLLGCWGAIRSGKHKSAMQTGASKTAIFFLLTVVGLIVHVGFRLFPIYYSYFELHNQMGSLIRVADELKDSEIQKRIHEQLKSLKIPADIDDVRIDRRAQTMLLSLNYVEILTLGFGEYKYDVWRFNFLCEVEDVIPQG